MDGASSLRIWAQVIMPLSSPVLAALTIFVFLGSWNDFLWPLVVSNSNATRTIPVGLATFRGQYNTDWHLLMAGSVIALAAGSVWSISSPRSALSKELPSPVWADANTQRPVNCGECWSPRTVHHPRKRPLHDLQSNKFSD